MDMDDWRIQLQSDLRQRIVNKIMDTLKKHLPFSGQEGMRELEEIAVRYEEKVYIAAKSQSEYLWKISFSMLKLNSQNEMADSLPSNNIGTSRRPPDPACSGELVLMNNNNSRPIQGGKPTMDTSNWRTWLQPDSCQRIINQIYLAFENISPHILKIRFGSHILYQCFTMKS